MGSVEINQDLSLLDQISLRGGIRHSLTRFLFGVGSVTPQTDSSLGWDLSPLCTVHTYTMAFVRVKSLNIPICRRLLIGSFLLQCVDMLSMPQVFEQSLFLFYVSKRNKNLSSLSQFLYGREHNLSPTFTENRPVKKKRKEGSVWEMWHVVLRLRRFPSW